MTRFEKRLGRCYELAGRYVLFDDPAEDHDPKPVLVHGTIFREGINDKPNPHAWVILPDGDRWEPISEMVMPEAVFTRFFGAVESRRYTVEDALILTGKTGHWGPWEE